jgi:hypothetical protein
VPDGHIGIPLMMHGSVGCGHVRVAVVPVGLLQPCLWEGAVTEPGDGGMANPEA